MLQVIIGFSQSEVGVGGDLVCRVKTIRPTKRSLIFTEIDFSKKKGNPCEFDHCALFVGLEIFNSPQVAVFMRLTDVDETLAHEIDSEVASNCRQTRHVCIGCVFAQLVVVVW